MYRFAGVRRQIAAKVESSGDCCVPVCGPSTCGTGEAEKEEAAAVAVKREVADDCCVPACGPDTCG